MLGLTLVMALSCGGNTSFYRNLREDWGLAQRPVLAVVPVSREGNRLLREIAKHSPKTMFAQPARADLIVEIKPDGKNHLSIAAFRRETGLLVLTRSWIIVDETSSGKEDLIDEYAKDLATNLEARFAKGDDR
jgi:hypothetical protein